MKRQDTPLTDIPVFADLTIEGPEHSISIPSPAVPSPHITIIFPNGVRRDLPKGVRPSTVIRYINACRP